MPGSEASRTSAKARHSRLAAGFWLAALGLLATALGWGGYELWITSHLSAARKAAAAHDWQAAAEHLQTCLRHRPHRTNILLLAARVERRLEHLPEAQELLAACPQCPGSETEQALLRVHRGELREVEPFLRERIANDDPDAVEMLDILSGALILDYRVLESQRFLDDLLRRQPDHFHALVRRAWTAQSLGWPGEAIPFLERAIALRPAATAARLTLAEILLSLGRAAEAHQHYDSLALTLADHPSVLFGQARCLAEAGKKEEAIEQFDRVLAANPRDWQSLGERGGVKLALDRPEQAEADLRLAAALAPYDLPLQMRLADCLGRLGKKDEAAACRAKADRLKEDFKRAEELGNIIREQKPNDPAPRLELGRILWRVGKQRDALHWLRTALEKDPRHRQTHETLAELLQQGGDTAGAAHHRQMLAELGPP